MNFTKSQELLSKAEKVIPVCTQTFSKGYLYFPKGVSPVYLEHGEGSHVWDVDGNKFIDFICGLGPITLGWNYPRINESIKSQLDAGIIFSLPHPLEVELSEVLNGIIPCAEMVRFFKTGSEACQAAIRAARAYTDRDHIAFRGYHGWHEWYAVKSERPKGIPDAYDDYIHQFEYNDIDSLRAIFDLYPDQVAAVIMEPVIVEKPKTGFLEQVKLLCQQNRALLIFDEIVTGFRWSFGGAQEYFNIVPDLACFGKGMANGMPLNCVVGRADIMKEFEEIFVSSTFGGECLSLAAGLATIQEMWDRETIEHCWQMGKKLMTGLQNIGLKMGGYPCRPAILTEFSHQEKALFIQEYIKRGILIHSSLVINLCYSHTTDDITKAVNACGEAYSVVRKTIASEDWSVLKGEIIQPMFRRL